MNKILFIFIIFLCQMDKGLCQEKPRIYFSGIINGIIKESQLSDTAALKITTNSSKKIAGFANVYFSGGRFSSVVMYSIPIGSNLSSFISSINGLKERVREGISIIIGGYLYTDKVTNKRVYFEESSYKVISD